MSTTSPNGMWAEMEAFDVLHVVRDSEPRKKLAHELQERVKAGSVSLSAEELPRYLASDRELARILVYLLVEFGKVHSTPDTWRQNVLSEWELLRRQGMARETSRMPLYYAIRAYVTNLRAAPQLKPAAQEDRALVSEIAAALAASPIDRKSQVCDRTIELQSLIGEPDSAAKNPADAAATTGKNGAIVVAIITAVGAIVVAIIAGLAKNTTPPSPTETMATITSTGNAPAPTPPRPKVFLIDSPSRRGNVEAMHTLLADAGEFDVIDKLAYINWLQQAPQLGAERPAVVLAHWHTLRPDFNDASAEKRDRRAEERLLQGLRALVEKAPNVKLILYSSSFAKQAESDSRRDITRAGERLDRMSPGLQPSYAAWTAGIRILPWPDELADPDKGNLQTAVRRAFSSK